MIIEKINERDFGNLEKERIVFKVTEDGDLGKYIIAKTHTIGSHSISSVLSEVFWLPDQLVKKDDLVVLYTKRGARNSNQNQNGTTSYFFYWGLEESLTNEPNNGIVVLETTWKAYRIDDNEQLSQI